MDCQEEGVSFFREGVSRDNAALPSRVRNAAGYNLSFIASSCKFR